MFITQDKFWSTKASVSAFKYTFHQPSFDRMWKSVCLSLAYLALAAVATPIGPATPCPWRYAFNYTCADLQTPTGRASFLQAMMTAESSFHAPGVGYDAATSVTYDGHPLNYSTGELYGQPHAFSAPSKESLHVSLLALAVAGNELARVFVGGQGAALSLLAAKMATYEAWREDYPAYGCHFPWVAFNGSRLVPADGWNDPPRVPGLDNGELVWAILAASEALGQAGYSDLAGRYMDWFRCMAGSAKAIFYQGNGTVAAVVSIANTSAPVSTPGNYYAPVGLLNDPYEGEALTVLLDLAGPWDGPEGAQEREMLWQVKRPQLQRVDYPLPPSAVGGSIAVQRGFWFSAHEQWKVALLPYLDVPLAAAVFRNGEVARTFDAASASVPGLFASVNDVSSQGSESIPDYASACGVQALASQQVQRRDIVTPYGAWMTVLLEPAAGLCWYHAMLLGPRMQGPYGSTEAIAINGTLISPLTTWDSKITTVLAAVGGVHGLVGEAMQCQMDQWGSDTTWFSRFTAVVAREYGSVFNGTQPSTAPMALPNAAIPQAMPDWTC